MPELADVEHRHLRSAIEFAVAMAEEVQKRKLGVDVPKELRPMYGKPRIPKSALGKLRRAIDRDDAFRELVARGALPELVDEAGRLWLQRPSGWEQQLVETVRRTEADEEEADARSALRREEKRRRAAEQAAVRVEAGAIEAQALAAARAAEIDQLRADLGKADDELAALRTELIDVRNEARHARDREAAARARAERLEADGPATTSSAPTPSGTSPATSAPTSSAEPPEPGRPPADAAPGVDPADLRRAIEAADAVVRELRSLLPTQQPGDGSPRRRRRRQPLPLPGGVLASSAEAARALLRSDATVLVDGYNVAKLGWPDLALDRQRAVLLEGVENLARRFGADLTVVFDGSSVIGAHADRHRTVRVAYSPEGVTADDVIRDEVARLPVDRAVVVVTNDAEIVRDVKAVGANVVPSNALLAVM